MKNIIITGASAGIGAATMQKFLQAGHRVIAGSRRHQKVLDSVEQHFLANKQLWSLPLDVCSQQSVEEFIKQAEEITSGDIDVVVNNAGLALGLETLAEGRIEDWQTMIDTNIMGVLRVTRAVLPRMIERQMGHLIFLSSISAHQVYEGGGVYCATKHAVRALAQTLRLELVGQKIRVSTIDPGLVETEFSQVRFRGDHEAARKVYQGIQALTAADVAECIYFVTEAPAHVNVDEMIVMPREQASVYKVFRDTDVV